MHLVSGFWDKAVEEELRNRLAASYVGSFNSEGEMLQTKVANKGCKQRLQTKFTKRGFQEFST